MTDPLEVLVPPGSLLAELRAARDRELAPVADLETSLTGSIAGPAWSEAISIVERYTKPMAGLDAEDLTRLRDSLPCLPAERHTFERLTGQRVDVDGGDDEGHCIATIGQDAWSLVVDLPEAANEWLNVRWGQHIDNGPIAFDLEVPTWVVDLVRDERPLLTLREAAPVLGVEPATLRQQAQAEWNGREGPAPRARRLGVVKLGRDWFVDRVAVEREATR